MSKVSIKDHPNNSPRIGYHVPNNSMWVEIVQVIEVQEEYFIADLNYYYKTSNVLFASEPAVKVRMAVFTSWDIYCFF